MTKMDSRLRGNDPRTYLNRYGASKKKYRWAVGGHLSELKQGK